jgi:hypothetical protein
MSIYNRIFGEEQHRKHLTEFEKKNFWSYRIPGKAVYEISAGATPTYSIVFLAMLTGVSAYLN